MFERVVILERSKVIDSLIRSSELEESRIRIIWGLRIAEKV